MIKILVEFPIIRLVILKFICNEKYLRIAIKSIKRKKCERLSLAFIRMMYKDTLIK